MKSYSMYHILPFIINNLTLIIEKLSLLTGKVYLMI